MEEAKTPGVDIVDEDPKETVVLTEGQPGEPALPESEAELDALVVAGELGAEEADEEMVDKVQESTGPEEKLGPPHEPDDPAEEEMPEVDPPGVVTALSKGEFKKLRSAWLGNGSPHRITVSGVLWHAIDDGTKFVSKGPPGGMGDYGSLSTGYGKG